MTGEVTRRVAKIEAEVVAAQPDVVFLNEVCSTQFEVLLDKLAARGYRGEFRALQDGYFRCRLHNEETGDSGPAWGTRSEGVAVLVKGPISGSDFHNLSEPGTPDEQAGMVCANTTLRSRPLRACGAHTHPTGAGPGENRKLAATVNPWVAAGIPVVVGGDLNFRPNDPSMSGMYSHTGGTGRFVEIDDTDKARFGSTCPQTAARCRSGEVTYETAAPAERDKLDYVFLSAPHFVDYSATVVGHDPDVTDHDVLLGEASWNPNTAPGAYPVTAPRDFNHSGLSDVGILYDDEASRSSLWAAFGGGTSFDAPIKAWDSGAGNFNWNRAKPISGDFDGDGTSDVAMMYNDDDARSSMWLAYGNGKTFQPPIKAWDSGAGNFDWDRTQITAGDYNGDGRSDIALLYGYSTTHSAIFTLDGTATGLTGTTRTWDSGTTPIDAGRVSLTSGDFTGDGKADLGLVHGYDGSRVVVYRLTATGTSFTGPDQVWDSGAGAWNPARVKVASGDFTGDGRADIGLLYNYDDSRTGLFTMTGTGTGTGFTAPQPVWDSGVGGFDWNRVKLTSGDFTGDGRTDLAMFYDEGASTSSLWIQASTGAGFAPPAKAWFSGVGNFNWNKVKPT
nr:FG-GAP-like repeat-containing protein [Streptomyces sp. SID3343]